MDIKEYEVFLSKKLNYGSTKGIDKFDINPMLFDFQKDITAWALRKGRACIFADCGLGKTFMQLEWARNILNNIDNSVLILAPLSVNEQTIDEAKKLDINVYRFEDNKPRSIIIANYENIHKLNPEDYGAIVIDESSILKSVDGKTKRLIIEFAQGIEYRLACTATPAPNDISEISNHVEYLGIMKREEMLSKWFFNNGSDWVLKGHALNKFYEWVATWGFFITKPSDIGYKDDGFDLPKLNINAIFHKYEFKDNGTLFDMGLKGIEDRIKIRKGSVSIKASQVADLVNKSKDQYIIWCGIDLEADTLHKMIKDSVNLSGKDENEQKTIKIRNFKNGKTRVLITKPKVAGFGLNFQNCHNMIFMGLSDSYESYYQCMRRCYRFGQNKDVNVLICLAGGESVILDNVRKKEHHSRELMDGVISKIKKYEEIEVKSGKHERMEYMTDEQKIGDNRLILGDSCVELSKLSENSIDMSVFSPPFASLYTYTNSERDLGNSKDQEEFLKHFKIIIQGLYRAIKPGRNVCVHCMNLPTKKIQEGFIGIKDFRGDIIRSFIAEGFIYHAEVTIDKNPQIAAIRTHAKGLMFKQMHKDSAESRMGLADYIVVFKKPGENAVPIIPDITNDQWIEYAHPVWYGIRETETLNSIKAEKDEKHICPLQLPVIERCLRLWSNPGEVILSPFMGIGSEGYQSIKSDRKFIGIELKKEYFDVAVSNIKKVMQEKRNSKHDLFSLLDTTQEKV